MWAQDGSHLHSTCSIFATSCPKRVNIAKLGLRKTNPGPIWEILKSCNCGTQNLTEIRMRKASKIIMVVAMGATAFTSLAGMASAM